MLLKISVICVLLTICSARDVVQMSMLRPAMHMKYEEVKKTTSNIYSEWTAFKAQFNRVYKSIEEEKKRFNIFMEHSLHILHHNKLHAAGKKNYKLGINHFADLTHDEWRSLTGKCFLGKKQNRTGSTFMEPSNWLAPSQVDWRKKGYVTPVKDQGQCGSCWAFSTTGSLEGQHFRKTGKLVSLSEQQLVDCSGKFGNLGCNGGLMDQAFDYIKAAGGIEAEKDYPYIDHDGPQPESCNFKKDKVAAKDTGHVDVLPHGDEDKLKKAVGSVGPVSVAIDASHQSFMLYKEGVYDEPECSSTQLDHGVLVVGYGTSDEGQDYWIVKNSWNTVWGEEGYVRMARNNNNQCGVATQASYPLV